MRRRLNAKDEAISAIRETWAQAAPEARRRETLELSAGEAAVLSANTFACVSAPSYAHELDVPSHGRANRELDIR